MIPGNRIILKWSVTIRIRANGFFMNGSAVEIGILKFLEVIIKHGNERMKFYEMKFSIGFQKMRNNISPFIQIGKPENCSIRSEDDVKFFVKKIFQFIYIATNEIRIDV